MLDNKKVFELNDDELDCVSGGTALISANTNRVAFSTTREIFSFKNCTYRQVRDLCESLIGEYPTEAEYDAACKAALKEKGWI
ncbi:MAG: hypothetical protein IJE08_07460 [Clostridia bacterium]|nr:hypothetical protein [Clostridia bacterium]